MTSQADYDSPWKDVLDLLFEDAMAFFFPSAHAQIDWSCGFEFLDTELQKITADAALGRRAVDKLVKVWLKTGQSYGPCCTSKCKANARLTLSTGYTSITIAATTASTCP